MTFPDPQAGPSKTGPAGAKTQLLLRGELICLPTPHQMRNVHVSTDFHHWEWQTTTFGPFWGQSWFPARFRDRAGQAQKTAEWAQRGPKTVRWPFFFETHLLCSQVLCIFTMRCTMERGSTEFPLLGQVSCPCSTTLKTVRVQNVPVPHCHPTAGQRETA